MARARTRTRNPGSRDVIGIRSGAAVRAVAVSPDGTRLATGGAGRSPRVRVRDTASGRPLLQARHGTFATAAAASPDRTRPAAGSGGTAARIGSAAGSQRAARGRGIRRGPIRRPSLDAVAPIGMARDRVSSLIVHRQNQPSACGFLVPTVPSSWSAAMICPVQAPCAGVSRFVVVARRVPCSALAAWRCCRRTCYPTHQAPSESA
jgi:hypothetical protein